jgi:phosphatidylserine decarboxylase
MLTKYGTDNIIIMLIISFILIVSFFFISKVYISYPLLIIGIVLMLFTLWFFRDPERIIPQNALDDKSTILSPADGKIVQIIDVEEKNYLKGKAKQISIFLSPLDVHVNRTPVTGKVEFYNYNPGDYLVAYHPKSSELNEQSQIGVLTDYGKVYFKQITGILARRIVCTVKEGDNLTIGEQIGMMKFGSRMDIIVSPNTKIDVKEGDRVIGGISIIGHLVK